MAGFEPMLLWGEQHVLSLLIFFPLIWATLSLLIPGSERIQKWIRGGWFGIGSLFLCALVGGLFSEGSFWEGDSNWQESFSWIPSGGIFYAVGMDGVSAVLVGLTLLFLPLACLFSLGEKGIERPKLFYFFLFSLSTPVIGAFLAEDLFLFYLFWEATLLPLYFLIGIWGGKERLQASSLFFIYTLVGSLVWWVGIFYLSEQHRLQFGYPSTLWADLKNLSLGSSVQGLLFLAFSFAFAIKVPLFPLHSWLPEAHVQAPTVGSVFLAAVLLKLGGYGFFRFVFPLFPEAVQSFQKSFLWLSVSAILYGALLAWVQTDLKKLVAYSSVSHMGFVVLGLFSQNSLAVQGAVFQMLSHGLATGGLFFIVGMLYERTHTRDLAKLGGLASSLPLLTGFAFFFILSSLGFPGTPGFVGEFLILLGSWKVAPEATLLASFGVIGGAVYLLSVFQKVFLGSVVVSGGGAPSLSDLSWREIGVLTPLVFLSLWFGFQPQWVFQKITPVLSGVIPFKGGFLP